MLHDIPIITPWVEDHLPITVEGQVQFPSSNSETKSFITVLLHIYVRIYLLENVRDGMVKYSPGPAERICLTRSSPRKGEKSIECYF